MYLHEAYQRSGYRLTVHPPIAGTSRHPDFLVEGSDVWFFLEVVRACAPVNAIAGGNKRLEGAQRILAVIGVDCHPLLVPGVVEANR